jgi:hypothetical protein
LEGQSVSSFDLKLRKIYHLKIICQDKKLLASPIFMDSLIETERVDFQQESL